MKNKLLLGTLLIGIASLFTSCKDDREYNPTFQTPTQFSLNTPATTDMYIQLSADNTVHLTWSQPNYGYNARATYSIQVGVVQADNSVKWCQKDIKDDAGNVIGQTDEYLSTEYYVCSADISGEEIAQAINKVDGVTKLEDYVEKGFREIAFRVRASLKEAETTMVPGSAIVSNDVRFKKMAAYATIRQAKFIYLIGSPHGWIAPNPANAEVLEAWKLIETEIGNNVFEGTFDIPAGDLQFRFYTYLDDWGSNTDEKGSMGPTHDDFSSLSCTWADDNTYTDKNIKRGLGNWSFSGYPGGTITFTVDLNNNTVLFTQVIN